LFAIGALKASAAKLSELEGWGAASVEAVTCTLAEELKLKTNVFFELLPVAFMGRTVAPLFQTMEIVGKEQCLKRLKTVLGKLTAP
jgi:glutamyl-tRNA synthetase